MTPTETKRYEIEAIMKECHMALLGLSPAPYAWANVNNWLAKHGKSAYAKKLKRIKTK